MKGSEVLFIIGLLAIEVEVVVVVLAGFPTWIALILVALTGLGLLLFWVFRNLKDLRLIAGHFCFSMQLYYSQNEYDVKDVLIAGYKTIKASYEILKQHESSNDFLDSFEEYITERKYVFPDELESIQEKYYYFELQKRIANEELQLVIAEGKKNNNIIGVLQAKLLEQVELAEKLSESAKIKPSENDSNEKDSEEDNRTMAGEGDESNESNDEKEEDSEMNVSEETKKIKTISKLVILLSIVIIITIYVAYIRDYVNISIAIANSNTANLEKPSYLVLMIGTIMIALLIFAVRKMTDSVKIVKKAKIDKSSEEFLNFTINQLAPMYPYYNFTYVSFVDGDVQGKGFGFKECIIITLQTFFEAFHFSKGFIFYNSYLHKALTCPCVMEYVGDIESDFPILFCKFSSGMVGKDEQNALTFNLVENAKVRTYYRMMCDLKGDNITKDDEILQLHSAKDIWHKQAIRNNHNWKKLSKYIDKKENQEKEEEVEMVWNIPKQYFPLVYIVAGLGVFFLLRIIFG